MGNGRNLAVYTISHFAVDFACFYLLFCVFAPSRSGLGAVSAGFLSYNVVAFGLQPFIGWFADGKRASYRLGAAGALLIASSYALWTLPWPALLLCALGNALFHVGAGADTLSRSGGKAASSGVFVSSGALGVSLGAYLGKTGLLPVWAVPALLLACALLISVLCGDAAYAPPPAFEKPRISSFGAVLSLCLTAVLLRAYIGVTLPVPWQSAGVLVFLGSVCAFLGKAAGGVLGDRLGARRVGVGSLLLSAALFAFAGKTAWGFAAGLFLFNMTMPLTLVAVWGQLPSRPGFAFGLTTLALLAGSAPTFFFSLSRTVSLYGGAALTFVSALLLYVSLTNQTGGALAHVKASSIHSSF